MIFARFLWSQCVQIHKGGFRIFKRKVGVFFGMALALPLVILVRLLRPLIIVRFGWLVSERIGHFVMDPEIYLSERDLGIQPWYTLDIFCYSDIVCNSQWKIMCDRTLNTTWIFRKAYRVNKLIPGWARHTVVIGKDHDSRPRNGVLARTGPHFRFTPEEIERGKRELKALIDADRMRKGVGDIGHSAG